MSTVSVFFTHLQIYIPMKVSYNGDAFIADLISVTENIGGWGGGGGEQSNF